MVDRTRFAALFALLFGAACAACALPGCAAEPEDDGAEGVTDGEGDGAVSEDELVSERQLMGSELPSKTLALTYDDGPGPRTAELADYLAEKGIPAAFFINGSKVPGRQAAVDKVALRGHLLANHTHRHLQLTKLSSSKVVSEISETDATISLAQPRGPSIIRAPFGAWNSTVARAVNGSGMKKYVGSVFWDVGGQLTSKAGADWDCWGKGYSVQRCGDLYLNEIRTKKRGIVLLHDIHGKSVDMTKYMVPTLLAEGYSFAKLTDVPSVKRALGAVAGGDDGSDGCSSATLGRSVAENVCVESRRDEKWYRCVDGEWASSAGPSDAKCTQRFPL